MLDTCLPFKADFKSKNCLRELPIAVKKRLSLILVHEADEEHGGLPLASLREQCPPTFRDLVFSHPMVDFHRINDFQLVSLRQIGQALLHPLLAARADDTLYIASELMMRPIVLPTQIVTSPHNPGAHALSQELSARASKVVNQPACFLLLLNADTFSDSLLALEVEAAFDAGQRLVLVHDTSVKFGDVIQRTPSQLQARGLYDELAVALYTGEHREVSLRHIAAKMAPHATSQPRMAVTMGGCCSEVARALRQLCQRSKTPNPSALGDGTQMLALTQASDRGAGMQPKHTVERILFHFRQRTTHNTQEGNAQPECSSLSNISTAMSGAI